MKRLMATCAALLIVAVPSAQALVNGGFETGDLTGWQTVVPSGGFAGAATAHSDVGPWTVAPVTIPPGETEWGPSDGDYFGLLKTDGPGSASILYQSFTVPAGTMLTLDYFWDSQDYVADPYDPPCYNDNLVGGILQGEGLGGAGETLLFWESVYNDLVVHGSNYWGTPWTQVSYTFSSGGTYTLVIIIENVCDSDLDSHVGIDAAALVLPVEVDIKPGSCPNPFNPKGKGSVPVAIVGTADLDVTTIDPGSITLNGVSALDNWVIKDSTQPSDSDPTDCYDCFDEDDHLTDTDGDGVPDTYLGDGFDDLVVKFDTQALAATMVGAEKDDCFELTLMGTTITGIPIEGSDSVLILKKIN